MEYNERKSLSLLISQVLPEWTEKENFLNRDFKFKDFTSAFSFMSEVALACEEIDWHFSNVTVAFHQAFCQRFSPTFLISDFLKRNRGVHA